MLIFTKIFAGVTAVVLLSMLTCGLWFRYSNIKPDAAGITFHTSLGIISIAMSLVLVVLVFFIKR